MLTYLIVCPLVFLGGFVDAVAGGGGLVTLPAFLLTGLPVHIAIGTNKTSSMIGNSFATAAYARKGYIPWKQAIFCVATAFLGSMLGANLALLVSDHLFKILMLVILPLTAFYITRPRSLQEKPDSTLSPFRTTLYSCIVSLSVGAYDGFYGPGSGTFLILLLTSVAQMELKKANGVAKAINLSTNIAAVVVYLMNGKVLVPLGLTAGAFNMMGSFLGTRFFDRSGVKAVRPLMLLVMGIFFIKVVLELAGIA